MDIFELYQKTLKRSRDRVDEVDKTGLLSTHFAEYFVYIGKPESDVEEAEKSFAANGSYHRIDMQPTEPTVLQRFPEKDRKYVKFPQMIGKFLFPNGISFEKYPRKPSFFCFVLTTEEGINLYCSALCFHHKVAEHQLNGTKKELFTALTACFVSRYPFFHAFREILRVFNEGVVGKNKIWPETVVSAALNDIPVVTPGGPVLDFPQLRSFCSLSDPTQLPTKNIAFRTVFDCLGINQTLQVVLALLLEKKVLLVSDRPSLLSICCEIFRSLLYPFIWPYIYISIAGDSLHGFVDAPTPFLIGFLRSGKKDIPNVPSAMVVDLDNGVIVHNPVEATVIPDMSYLAEKLRKRTFWQRDFLDSVTVPRETKNSFDIFHADPADTSDTAIRMEFLYFFAQLLFNYKDYIILMRKYPSHITYFNKHAFWKSLPPGPTRNFLREFMDTQMFSVFIDTFAMSSSNVFDTAMEILKKKGKDEKGKLFRHLSHKKTGENLSFSFPEKEETRPIGNGLLLNKDLIEEKEEDDLPVPDPDIGPGLERAFTGAVDSSLDHIDAKKHTKEGDFIFYILQKVFNDEAITPKEDTIFNNVIDLDGGFSAFCAQLIRCASLHEANNHPISHGSYIFLAKALRKVLSNSKSHGLAGLILKPIAGIFTQVNGFPQFIPSSLKDVDLWKNFGFWDSYFHTTLFTGRKVLPLRHNSSVDDWDSLPVDERHERVMEDDRIAFEAISNVIMVMVAFGIDKKDSFALIDKFATATGLPSEQITTLHTLEDSLRSSSRRSEDDHVDKKSEKPEKPKKPGKEPAPVEKPKRTAVRAEMDEIPGFKKFYSQFKSVTANKGNDDSVSVTLNKDAREPIDCLAGDEVLFASGAQSGRVTVWSKRDRTPFGFMWVHNRPITGMKIDSNLLYSCSLDTSVCVSNLQVRKVINTFNGHKDGVLCIDAMGDLIASGGKDNKTILWDRRTNGIAATLEGHTGPVNSVCMKTYHSLPYLATASDDETVKLWDLRTNKAFDFAMSHSDAVNKVQITSPYIISSSNDGTAKFFNLKTGELFSELKTHTAPVRQFVLKPKKNLFLTGSDDGTIGVWKLSPEDIKLERLIGGFSKPVSALCTLKSGHIVAGGEDATIRVFNPNGEVVCLLADHEDKVTSLLPTRDNCLISSSLDSTVKLWSFTGPSFEMEEK